MAMFKKRISEESSASESQWSSEQIQASASVTKLGEFGGKTQGSFDDDVVTTSIHWVSFEDLPDKDDKDATVGDTQLKWPSWKKGATKFSKALSSPATLREKPEPELTGRISSICRPLSAYGSVRNMDRGIVTATVGYQTDGNFVEEAEQHISSTEITFHNDSIDSGHEGNFEDSPEDSNQQRDESLSSNPLNCSNSSAGEHCNTTDEVEGVAGQKETWQDSDRQFTAKSASQCWSTEVNDSKCTDERRPCHIQQVPENMKVVGLPDQQAGLATGADDCGKEIEDVKRSTAFSNSSNQGNDAGEQLNAECNDVSHHGGSNDNVQPGIVEADIPRLDIGPVVSESSVASPSTNCAWNETKGIITTTTSPFPDHITTKSVADPSCNESKQDRQNKSCPNEGLNSYESREGRSREDNYAVLAQEVSTRERKKEDEPPISSLKDGGVDQQPSISAAESSEDEGYLVSGHFSQEGAENADLEEGHSRVTQQTCSTSDRKSVHQDATPSLEKMPSAEQPMHAVRETVDESEYCQCTHDGTNHEVQATQSDDSSYVRQLEDNDNIVSMQYTMESRKNDETSDRRLSSVTGDALCPNMEKEDVNLQHHTQEGIRSRSLSEDLDTDRQEQTFPSQMASSSPFGSPPRLLSFGNPPKQPNSPRRRGSPRIDQIADKLLKNAVVLVERLPRSITDKASQKVKEKDESPQADSVSTGNSIRADNAPTPRVGAVPPNISNDLSVPGCSPKELRGPIAPPKKRNMKKLLPKPSDQQRYADAMYPYVHANAAAIPFYPSSTHGSVAQQDRGQQSTMPPPPPNGLQYPIAPHGTQYPLGSSQQYHDNGAHQRFYAPYPGARPRYLPPATATPGFRNAAYPDTLQAQSNQSLQQPNPSLVVRIREVGPESMLATQNRALDGQPMTADNVAPIYHHPQAAMEGSTGMHHQRPRFAYHANGGSSLQESRQGAMSSQGPLATDTRKPASLIDAVIEEMYDRDETAIAQERSAWRMGTSTNRTERPVVPEVFVSPPARRLKENREVKSAMNLVDKMIEDAYFSSKPVKDADVPPAKEVRPFGHSRYSPPLTVSMSDGGPPSVHSTPPAHPKDFMSALVARVVDEEYAKDDVAAAVPERPHHDRQLQDNSTPYGDQPNLPEPIAKPHDNSTSNQEQEDQMSFTNVRSEPAYGSKPPVEAADVLSNTNNAQLQDGQGHEIESNTEVITSDNQDTPAQHLAGTPRPRNVESEIPTEIPKPKNFDTISDSSLETQRPDAILLARPPDENSPSENNGHRCATGRAEPDLKSLMPSLQDPDGKECAEAAGPISNNAANNDLATETTAEEKETLGNSNEKESASWSGGENIINFSPRIEPIRDSSSNEQSPIEKESSTSKDLPPNSTTPVDSESADQLSDLCVVELGEAADLVVDEETASNDRDDANEEVERRRRLEEGGVTEDVAIAPAAPPPNELTGRGEGKGEHNTPSALKDERDKSGPKRAGRLKGRKRGGVEGKHKKSMTRVRDKAESSATSEARIAHEFPRHNWLMKHLMAEQQLVTNRKDPESRKSPSASEKDQADPNGEQCKQEEEEEEKTPGEVEGTVVVKEKSRSKQQGKLSRDSSLESFTSLDTLSSTDKLEGENDNVFPGPVSPTTTEETGQQEVSQPKSHSPKLSIAEKSTEDSETVDDRGDSSDKGLPTKESAAVNSSDSQAEAPQTSARQSQEEPLNLSLKAARFVDFYNSIGSKNIAKAAAEGGEVEAGASTASEHVNDGAESHADRGDCTEPPAVPSATLDAGLKKEDLPVSSENERASTEQSSPNFAASQSGSYTPITVTVHTAVPKANSTPPQASDPAKASPETKPAQVSAMGNVQDRPVSRNNTSMFSFEDVPKDQRAPRQDGHHQGAAPKRPASPTVRCPPRKRSTVDSGVVCLSPYSPVSPSDKTTSPASAATKLHEEIVPKRRAKTACLPETATATATYQFAVPSQQAVLPSKKSQALRSSSSGGQERPSVISVVPVTPPLPPRPSAPPPPPHDTPYRGDHSVTAALLARLEVMTKNKVNIERELVNQELLLTELRKRSLEDKSGLLRKQSQEKEALLFHMRMTYNKLCEDIDYLMRSGPTKFADGQKSTHSTAPNSTAPNSIGPSSQAIPIHRAQSDSAITLQAGGKIGGEAGNRWRETAPNERRSSDGENSSDVQIIGQKGPTMSSSLQDFRHVNPHVNPPPYLDPRYVTDPRQAALMYGTTTAGQQYPAISTVAQNHISPRSVAAPRFSPYAQAQSDLAAATAAERRRQAHMDVKRAKQILNEHKSFVEKYSRPPGPGELAGNPHNITTGSEVQLNPPVNTAIPQASVQGGVPTSTVHPYPHGGVPIHPAVTMAQVIPILPGDPSFAPRSTAMAAHMVAPDQRPLPAMTHQGMPPFYYISPGMPVPAGYQQQPIPGQSPRVLNPVTQQLLSPPPGQQTPTSTTPSQLNNLRGVHHRPPNATSIVNSKEPPPAAQHHPVLLPGKPSPGQMCHHQQLQQYGWPGQLPTNSAEMNAAYFAAHAAQHAAVQSRAEAAMKRGGSSVKDHLQRPNVVALPEMQQAAYLSKHFKPFSVTGPPENSIMHPSKTHPVHLQQARTQPKDLITRVGQQTAREAAYLQDIQGYHANHQPASVFRGNPMMRGPGVVENGQGSPGTMVGPPRRDTGGGVVSIADDEYHSCVVCNKEATFLCSGCRKAWYCSPTCQVQAWEKHSEDCL